VNTRKNLKDAESTSPALRMNRRGDSAAHPLQVEIEMKRLVQELEVHQLELEMQNEELRQAQEALESSRNAYAELYDFAPAGYFSFDRRDWCAASTCRAPNCWALIGSAC
jgi:hypothetical protein